MKLYNPKAALLHKGTQRSCFTSIHLVWTSAVISNLSKVRYN